MRQFSDKPGTGPVDYCNARLMGHFCRHDGDCLTAYGHALLEAFRDANPGVEFTTSNNPCLSVIGPRRVNRHSRCDSLYVGGLIDHEGAARVKGGQAVYIPQPYYTAKYEGFDGLGLTRKLAEDVGRMKCVRKHLSGMRLVVKYAGSGRSWYYPGRSALWAIGAQEAVESMNFEYEPPPPPAEVARYGEEPVKVAPEDFDAPCSLPTWEIQLPVWTCQFVTNRGNLCGKPSVGRSWPPTWGHRLESWPEDPPSELVVSLCDGHYMQGLNRWISANRMGFRV